MEYRDLVKKVKRNLPSIDMLVGMSDVKRKGDDIQGSHPVHGSETGSNLILHPSTGTWHCFRHDVTSDKLGWIAVSEGIIDCEDAGELTGTDFIEVLEIACERAGIEMDWEDYDKEEVKKRRDEWVEIQEAFEIAVEHWKDNLNDDVIEFIKNKYGFDEEEIEELEIGYADPDEKSLCEKLQSEVGQLTSLKTGLVWERDGQLSDVFRGRVVFPYKFHDEYTYFIARETEWTDKSMNWNKGKYLKQLTPKRFDFVSDQIENHLWGLDTLRGADEVIVTEGISDAMSLYLWGYSTLSPVTTRFRDEDINKVKRAIRDKTVYVCNDNDQGGLDGALDTLEEVDNSYLIEFPDHLPEGYDVNDLYKDKGREAFEELKRQAVRRDDALALYRDDITYLWEASLREHSCDPQRVRKVWDNDDNEHKLYGIDFIFDGLDAVKDTISAFRRQDKTHFRSPTAIESRTKKRVIAGVVTRHMMKHGKFLYNRDTNTIYYFSEENHEVLGVNTDDGQAYLSREYGVNKSTEEGKYLTEEVKSHALTSGEEVDVKRYFHYDKKENKLYIYNRNYHYYVLDGDSIEKEMNGKNVYFETMNQKEIEYLEPDEREYMDEVPGQFDQWEAEGSFLHQMLCNRTNFASKTALTRDQQRMQLMVSLYMFPFYSYFRAKPINAFIGEKGSGKSITLKMLSNFLMYPGFDVSSMPDDKKDFLVVCHNNPLYFLDNVDESESWMNDALASVATGTTMKVRELYTNFEQAEAQVDTFLAITSRTPEFDRDDVVDRLLIYYVQRVDKNIDPNLLIDPIDDCWNTLWSEYIDDLNSIVKVMGEIDRSDIKSEHRLVEWVIFANIVQRALGLDEDEVQDLINDMRYEKMAFSLQDDRILPALRNLKESPMHNTGQRWLPASELYEKLTQVDDMIEESYPNAQSLARRLPNIKTELEGLVGLKVKRNRNKHRNEYMLVEDEGGLDDFLQEKYDDEEEDNESETRESSLKFSCNRHSCDKEFESKQELEIHIINEHEDTSYTTSEIREKIDNLLEVEEEASIKLMAKRIGEDEEVIEKVVKKMHDDGEIYEYVEGVYKTP